MSSYLRAARFLVLLGSAHWSYQKYRLLHHLRLGGSTSALLALMQWEGTMLELHAVITQPAGLKRGERKLTG